MGLEQVWLSAALVQAQAGLASYLPMPPCLYGCHSPDTCLLALVIAAARSLLGAPC